MAAPQVSTRDGIQEWVGITNDVGGDLGDPALLGRGTDIVDGINEIDADIGTLSGLATVDQSSLVAALNEVQRTAFVMALVLATPIN